MRTLTLLLVLLTLSLLAGCGPRSAPPGGDGTAPAAKPQTTVRFLAMEYDTNTRPFMAEFEQTFEAAHPTIDLQIEIVDWDGGHQKLSTLVNANNPPDLANIATLWIAEYTDLDALEPLESHLSADFLEGFDPLSFHGARQGDHLYGLPIAMSARALYCNLNLLQAHGCEPPTNWDELVAVARKCTDPAKKNYGFGVQGAKVETDVYWYYFLWNNGGEILSADLKKPAFNSPEGVAALQFVVDLVHKHKVSQPDPTAYNREGLQDLFKSGQLAMMITGPWFWSMLDKDAPDLKYQIVPIPSPGKQVTMAVTDNLVMFKGSADKAAAAEVIKAFYEQSLREKWAQTFYMLPELKSVQQAQFVQDSPQWSALLKLLPTGRFVPLHPRWTTIATEITTGVQEALLQQKTPQQALTDAAARVQQVLDGK
jgi:multiple sugar transport system substrate-binding protein